MLTLDIRALAGYPPANTDILTQPEADRIMAREHDRRLADIWAGRMTPEEAADVIAAYSADPFDGCSGDGSTLDASSHPAQERKP